MDLTGSLGVVLEEEELKLLHQKMEQTRDAAFDARMEVAKLKFELAGIRWMRRMERYWIEMKIAWERALIDNGGSSLAPHFGAYPSALRANLRINDLAMQSQYNRRLAEPRVNRDLRAVICAIGPGGVTDLKSEQLKRKWAPLERELSSLEARRVERMHTPVKDLPEAQPQRGDSELHDGELHDVKRLDEEVEHFSLKKGDWKKWYTLSYTWYRPYVQLSSREEHLAEMVERLAKRDEARGTATLSESEAMGYILLDLLVTSAFNPSVTDSTFPPP